MKKENHYYSEFVVETYCRRPGRRGVALTFLRHHPHPQSAHIGNRKEKEHIVYAYFGATAGPEPTRRCRPTSVVNELHPACFERSNCLKNNLGFVVSSLFLLLEAVPFGKEQLLKAGAANVHDVCPPL
ncbi:hypothetical protein EVAR_61073_1 [Eumeta japonica]|uniref:Uncharacterized protein n=1 Tax=Eumeta variegata TaxID=151549 RepID=A0A4C1Z9V1_EUMVA|nr:hypothetical protein EVAR_61073_1 [Eumeta japonica]